MRQRSVLALLFVLGLFAGCKGPSAAPPVAPKSKSAVTATAPAPRMPEGWPYASPPVVRGEHGMVVTDEAIATRVGRDVLASGGNAADAAVAVAFALAVTYPAAGNLGGGGFAVTRVHGQARALDFREAAPAAAKHDMFTGKDGEPVPGSRSGIRSVGVPGSVAGLHALYQELGSKKKTWAELVRPAVTLAEEGFVVSESFAAMITRAKKRLDKSAASRALFLPGGAPPPVGSTFTNPDLAKTLARIAEAGPKAFYEGPVADAIAAEMKRDGGLITTKDLAAYRAKWREPLTFTYRRHRITSMPPPSSGGVTFAMIAHILEGYDLGHIPWHSPAHLHLVAEAMRRAFAARNAKLGDPDFVTMPLERLLSDAWAKEQRATIRPGHATPSSEIPTAAPASGTGPHTTHFSIVDAEGNAVALTTTQNWWFGSGVTVAGTGVVLNNEMDDFASVPGTANGFGLVQGEANAIAPGKRMLSSMTPTIVTDEDGRVVLVNGAAGGPTIISATFLEVSNVVDFGLPVGQAVGAPRIHMQHLPDLIRFEEGGLAPTTKSALEGMGYTLEPRDHIADAPAIGRDGATWLGVAEPRRKGALAAAPR